MCFLPMSSRVSTQRPRAPLLRLPSNHRSSRPLPLPPLLCRKATCMLQGPPHPLTRNTGTSGSKSLCHLSRHSRRAHYQWLLARSRLQRPSRSRWCRLLHLTHSLGLLLPGLRLRRLSRSTTTLPLRRARGHRLPSSRDPHLGMLPWPILRPKVSSACCTQQGAGVGLNEGWAASCCTPSSAPNFSHLLRFSEII